MLQLFRLKRRQDWTPPSEGLYFLFLMAGAGESLGDVCAPPAIQPLARGDVLVLRAGVGCKVRGADESELVFSAFSVYVEHLIPIFLPEQFALVQTLMDSFTTARYYAANDSTTIGWHQLIRERRATFSCRPDLPRPATQTPLRGLWLAGDYVCADYPATLEGAARSGVAAARSVLADMNNSPV